MKFHLDFNFSLTLQLISSFHYNRRERYRRITTCHQVKNKTLNSPFHLAPCVTCEGSCIIFIGQMLPQKTVAVAKDHQGSVYYCWGCHLVYAVEKSFIFIFSHTPLHSRVGTAATLLFRKKVTTGILLSSRLIRSTVNVSHLHMQCYQAGVN